jgi:hypothetical protein
MIRKASSKHRNYITRRLLRSMPASKFEMQTLTRLAGIVITPDVPTASVECKRHPRMLINPQFVADNCPHDEHLFLLVMHELWHVLLAHTRMYPVSTRAHNIAFDAIINAGLMAKFPHPEYRGFFDKMYKADEFPYCLLRPPEGWPSNPVYPEVGPPGTKAILERLYPPFNYRPFHSQRPMYEEILKLLLDSGMNLDNLPIMLLGNHDSPARHPDGSPINDPFMKEAVKKMADKWPNMMMDGRGYGRNMNKWQVDVATDYDNARRAFSRVLKKALAQEKGRSLRRDKVEIIVNGANGVIPNPHDRYNAVRRALNDQSLLYSQRTPIKVRIPEKPTLAHVYLDVSGSMRRMLPHLLGLLIPYARKREVKIFQFSTQITGLTVPDLAGGKLTTTGGTNINCVLEHIVNSERQVKKVLLVTDGEVGSPKKNLRDQIEELGTIIHAVLPSGCVMHPASEPLMESVIELPPAG